MGRIGVPERVGRDRLVELRFFRVVLQDQPEALAGQAFTAAVHEERLLGELVSTVQTPILIASKFAPLPHRWTAGSIRRALHGSLRRLQVDCIDLYQVHWYLPTIRIETLMNVLADAVEEGKIRAIGVSNYRESRMRLAHEVLAKRGLALASNQVEYHLLNRECEHNGVLQACQELGITLIAYSPLGKGRLTGKYRPGTPVSGARSQS